MSPQPKWRVSTERLEHIKRWREFSKFGMPPIAIEVPDLAADNIDARAEIDRLQAAVRELRAGLESAAEFMRKFDASSAGLAMSMEPDERRRTAQRPTIFAQRLAKITEVLALTDKLLPENEAK